ncbi:MAG: AlpA family phage regulatory protein [Devosia sp.]
MTTDTISPYTMDEAPTSVGRVLLARAFAHWCVIHYGHDPAEVAAAFDANVDSDAALRRHVHFAARLLGELIASGEIHSWARAFGGGGPAPIPATDWELDDFRPRFASSAFDPARPFDRDAPPTHWIFLELADFNRIVEASCADVVPSRRVTEVSAPAGATNAAIAQAASAPAEDRHVRMPEIVRRTGMSTSTVYRRIGQGRFPRQIPMESGNIASWWESEVSEWIANPR